MSFSRLQTSFTGVGDIALRDARAQIDVIEVNGRRRPKPPPSVRLVNAHLFDVDVERAGRRRARIQRILDAGPDLGAVAVDARGAHHRLHRRVGEKRHAVVGGHDLRGAWRGISGSGAERLCRTRRKSTRVDTAP